MGQQEEQILLIVSIKYGSTDFEGDLKKRGRPSHRSTNQKTVGLTPRAKAPSCGHTYSRVFDAFANESSLATRLSALVGVRRVHCATFLGVV